MDIKSRTLFFGDNLEILREKFSRRNVFFDLIYLDPPFNSNKSYNVLFKEGLVDSPAQVSAFEDSWHWTPYTMKTFEELAGARPSKTPVSQEVSDLIVGLEKIIGHNDMMAYLTMMTIRLIELHGVLKETGSLYLHCDSTASHYLKVILDAIFGKKNFRNEIVWQRFPFHADAKRFGRVTDRILFYTKSENYKFNTLRVPFSEKYIASKFVHRDEKGRYRLDNLNPPAERGPVYEFHGVKKAWRFTKEKMMELEKQGKIYTKSKIPQLKRYLHELEGQAVHELWNDISNINPQAKERLGYPTQKPEMLLERIIRASTDDGDWVLDPFCGCGTTLAVSERLDRNWIGIDVTVLAINLIKDRLKRQFKEKFRKEGIQISVEGLPRDIYGAKALFDKDPFEFQYWVLDMIKAMPTRGKSKEHRRGADFGIDGIVVFRDIDDKHRVVFKRMIVSVKGGRHVSVNEIRDLKGVVEREKAEGGLFVTLAKPTEPMIKEASVSGFFKNRFLDRDFPRIQIVTVEDLLTGKRPEIPSGIQEVDFVKRAEKSLIPSKHKQKKLSD